MSPTFQSASARIVSRSRSRRAGSRFKLSGMAALHNAVRTGPTPKILFAQRGLLTLTVCHEGQRSRLLPIEVGSEYMASEGPGCFGASGGTRISSVGLVLVESCDGWMAFRSSAQRGGRPKHESRVSDPEWKSAFGQIQGHQRTTPRGLSARVPKPKPLPEAGHRNPHRLKRQSKFVEGLRKFLLPASKARPGGGLPPRPRPVQELHR